MFARAAFVRSFSRSCVEFVTSIWNVLDVVAGIGQAIAVPVSANSLAYDTQVMTPPGVASIVVGTVTEPTLFTDKPLNWMKPAAGFTVVGGVIVVVTTTVGDGDEEDDVFDIEEVAAVILVLVIVLVAAVVSATELEAVVDAP
jgi:hypothetical protein